MFKIKTKKQAFTLVELLVVIAIIGILATLAVVSLQNARARARDAKRIADVKQMQTALELYFNDAGQYPATVTSTIAYGANVYMATVPTAPTPPDGDCAEGDNTYSYSPSGSENEYYEISFCLGSSISNLSSGDKVATPAGITDLILSSTYYTLNVNKTVCLGGLSTTGGSVTSNPSGISCNSIDEICSFDFLENTEVVLTAAEGFLYWISGCNSVSGNECTVLADEIKDVYVDFAFGDPCPS